MKYNVYFYYILLNVTEKPSIISYVKFSIKNYYQEVVGIVGMELVETFRNNKVGNYSTVFTK